MESGECVKTLQGHLSLVCRLDQLESDELVSCSLDCAIKIWNLTKGICIQTLLGHSSNVTSIRVNGQNNTLASVSYDGTIKIWNLKTCECVETIEVTYSEDELKNLILI